jgi:hypothetical protein
VDRRLRHRLRNFALHLAHEKDRAVGDMKMQLELWSWNYSA